MPGPSNIASHAGAFVVGAVIATGIWLLVRSSSSSEEESVPPLPAPPLPLPEAAPPANTPANTPGINPASTPAAPAANPGATAVPTMKPNEPAASPAAPAPQRSSLVWVPNSCASNADCGAGKKCQNGKCVLILDYSTSE